MTGRFTPGDPDSFLTLLGGRRSAVDAILPTVGFVLAWWLSDGGIGWGVAAAVATGVVVGVLRLRRGSKVTAVLAGVLGVVAAGLVALYTGRAADFFLLQIV